VKDTSALHEYPKTSAVITQILLVLFIFVFVLFMYTFLHESGHAITGFLFGQTLIDFDVNFLNFGAHVGMMGNMTRAQLIIQSVAGEGLPLLIWLGFLSLVPRKASFSLEVLKLLGSMIVLNTLLAWIVIPVLYVFRSAPADDVTHFLTYSQMPPLLVTFIALILYLGGWAYFSSRIDGLRNELLLFHITNLNRLMVGTRRTVLAMAGILALCILLTFTLKAAAAKNSAVATSEDFVPVTRIDLSTQAYSAEVLAQFTLEEPAEVGVFVIVRDINTTYFDLSVIGPDGYSSTVLHGEGYSAYQDSSSWKETLPAGTYRVVLTSHQSPGTASVYLKTP
jgi:hypothetical protein